MDNPGWSIKFNISSTLYENVAFNDVKIDRTEHDWVRCKKENGEIMCAGGPKNLEEMLEIVKDWMESNKPTLEAVNEFNLKIMEVRKFYNLTLPD
ncbi:MAG: immunity 53 family protein [Firmicutes bacterium]|nr:immunity 53 family protein [Bacillota bacterium]